jgi:2-(3-amino-3-carboxypropyl)histidine synthase
MKTISHERKFKGKDWKGEPIRCFFIPARIKSDINEKKISDLKLPKEIAIAYSIQYKEIAERINSILSKNHKITSLIQVLGCSKPVFSKETKAILLVSSGKFHAISIALETKLPVYVLESDELRKISQDEISALQRKKNAAYLRFLNAEKIGILVSTKPGQENLKKAILAKDKIKNKKSYLFISNNIAINEFENFPDIKSWVNTACPRMDFDSSIFNLGDLDFSHSKNSLNSHNNSSRNK